jgi:hypothetical protein
LTWPTALLDGMHDELNHRAVALNMAAPSATLTPSNGSIMDPDTITDIHMRAAFVWNKYAPLAYSTWTYIHT